jgi:hypothetical protein
MPTDKDFAVTAVGSQLPGVPSGAIYAGGVHAGTTISKKPCYLICLDVTSKSKGVSFISLDKPEFVSGFVQVKGFYCTESENDIMVGFQDLVRATPKEKIMEVFLPWHRVHNITSLVFNANKPVTIPNK